MQQKMSVQHQQQKQEAQAHQMMVSTSITWKICYDDLSLFAQKTHPCQPLLEDATARHYTFVRVYGAQIVDNPGVFNVPWFSNEAHFHLDGYINILLSPPDPVLLSSYFTKGLLTTFYIHFSFPQFRDKIFMTTSDSSNIFQACQISLESNIYKILPSCEH